MASASALMFPADAQPAGSDHYPISGGGPENPWQSYFGHPPTDMKVDVQDKLLRENYELPEAYEGQNQFLMATVLAMVTKFGDWPMRVMPPVRTQQMRVKWRIFETAQEITELTPPQAPPRMVETSHRERSAELMRHALGFIISHGFWRTPMGRMIYQLNLETIRSAALQSIYQGVIAALLDGHNYWREYQRRYGGNGFGTVGDALRWEKEVWASAQKTHNGMYYIHRQMEAIASIRNIQMDFWIAPEQMQKIIALIDNHQTDYSIAGPAGPQQLKNYTVAYDTFYGAEIYEAKTFHHRNRGRGINMLERQRQIGGHFFNDLWGSNLDMSKYETWWRDTLVFGMSPAEFRRVRFRDALRHTNRFKGKGGLTDDHMEFLDNLPSFKTQTRTNGDSDGHSARRNGTYVDFMVTDQFPKDTAFTTSDRKNDISNGYMRIKYWGEMDWHYWSKEHQVMVGETIANAARNELTEDEEKAYRNGMELIENIYETPSRAEAEQYLRALDAANEGVGGIEQVPVFKANEVVRDTLLGLKSAGRGFAGYNVGGYDLYLEANRSPIVDFSMEKLAELSGTSPTSSWNVTDTLDGFVSRIQNMNEDDDRREDIDRAMEEANIPEGDYVSFAVFFVIRSSGPSVPFGLGSVYGLRRLGRLSAEDAQGFGEEFYKTARAFARATTKLLRVYKKLMVYEHPALDPAFVPDFARGPIASRLPETALVMGIMDVSRAPIAGYERLPVFASPEVTSVPFTAQGTFELGSSIFSQQSAPARQDMDTQFTGESFTAQSGSRRVWSSTAQGEDDGSGVAPPDPPLRPVQWTKNMAERWAYASSGACEDVFVEQGQKLAILAPVTGAQVEKWLDCNVCVPMSVLNIEGWRQFYMGTAVYGKRGLGTIFYGHESMALQDDAIAKVHVAHFDFYHVEAVQFPWWYMLVEDMIDMGYIGGFEHNDFYDDNETRFDVSRVSENRRTILAHAVPLGTSIKIKSTISIPGRWDSALVEGRMAPNVSVDWTQPTYPGALYLSYKHKLYHLNAQMNLDNDREFSSPFTQLNVVSRQMMQYILSPQDYQLSGFVLNNDGFGINGYSPTSGIPLAGGAQMFEDMEYQKRYQPPY